jgi:protein-S-isoprenylcysteine O-methyltransferase Ste14
MIKTFDDDGRRQEPKPSRDWWVPAFVVGLVAVSAGGSWAIAAVLDANLSPGRVAGYFAGFLALAALFALREWTWRVERAERIAYEAEQRRELARERRANLAQQLIIDDLIAEEAS